MVFFYAHNVMPVYDLHVHFSFIKVPSMGMRTAGHIIDRTDYAHKREYAHKRDQDAQQDTLGW